MSVVDVQAAVTAPPQPDREHPLGFALLLRLLRTVLFVAISAATALGLWVLFIKAFHLNPYFAKSPSDVWHYLTSDPEAAANRAELRRELAVTVRDAALGYVFGTIAALVIAISFVMSRTVEQTFLPVAVALRSVPLVAMTPLLTLAFGRDILGVTVIAGIVTFFPSLVILVQGLRSAPADAVLLMRAVRRQPLDDAAQDPDPFVRFRRCSRQPRSPRPAPCWVRSSPSSWRPDAASARSMLTASSSSRFNTLWASVVLVTLVAVAVYAFVGLIEAPVLRRFAPAQTE